MGFEQLHPWLELRRELPIGPLLCVINGTTRGRQRLAPALIGRERGAARRAARQ